MQAVARHYLWAFSLSHDWCYTAIVRPILLYGAIVWWTGLKKSTYRKPMESVQRLAALCITGALRTTPTAALERILNLPPIDLFAETYAAKSAGRLLAGGEFTHRTFGHSSVGRGGLASTDYLTPLMNWERIFRVNLEKDGWREGMITSRSTLNIYTDGSKMEDGVGAGIYYQELGVKQPFKLPNNCSIAIGKAAELVLNTAAGYSKVNIYVDSQAAIKATTSVCISAKSVLDTRMAVERVARNRTKRH
uniref:Putative 115 kDa protein in type-1 retrotransposable element R1DM n=1 Tax=Zeugodacus cucurbitae TaxID=28588 RepID=A0A0A1XKT2_ZEUCU